MKFLADMGISMRTVLWLRDNEYDAVHLREEGLQRSADEEILVKAQIENRVILTMDLDFGYLLSVCKETMPSVIIFRLSDERSEIVNQRLSEALIKCENDLDEGCIISVSDKTIRIRHLPI